MRPEEKTEEVQIVELPVDDQSETTNDSIVIVTQPVEQTKDVTERKEEEEIIVLERTIEGETKVRKIKKPVKVEEEVIIEIEEKEGKKRVVKKKLTAYKPNESEEINELENTSELIPFEASHKKEIPLNTHMIAAESVPTDLVTQTFEEEIPSENVLINISTFSAVSNEETLPNEKEEYHDKPKIAAFTAKPSVDAIETYQVSEEDIQNVPGTFEDTFKPAYSKAAPSFLSNDSITVSETREEQSVVNIQKQIAPSDIASVSLLLQEATSVSETEASTREETFEKASLPKTSTASKTYITQEGIAVEEIQENVSESQLDIPKTISSKPKVDFNTLESLIVEEVFTDNKPGKHLPESFVPTEMANQRIIPQNQIVSSEIVAPEMESEFIPGRLPPTQTAGFDVTLTESLLVEQIQPEYKETSFKESNPEQNNASEEMLLYEGVAVSVVDTQMPTTEVTSEKVDQQNAIVEYLTKQSVIATTTLVSESEKDYQPEERIESRTATTEIMCLETSNVSDVVIQDSESPLLSDSRPTQATAEESVKAVIPLTISEVEAADTSDNFVDYPKYVTQEATTDILTQNAKEITETQFGEKESLYTETAPSSYNTNVFISETQMELEVTETKTMESESNLVDFELPASYKGKTTSAHMLTTSVVEEVTPENTTDQLTQETPKHTSASLTQATFDETVVSEAVIGESLGQYQPEQKSEDKQANLTISEHESISVTEVISDDRENTYLPKETPKQYQATFDISAQKVASTTEITSNFLPDILPEDRPFTDKAKSDQTVVEGIQVTQFQTADKENENVSNILPDVKTATPNITEGNTEINVTQILLHEKEGDYEAQQKPIGLVASTGVATQEVAIQSETETVVHADNIPDDEPVTGRAKKYARPLQELIVTESNAVDIHKDLPKDIFPYEKQANVKIIPGQQLTVTEIVTDDKEGHFDSSMQPEGKRASATVSERETAIQEETLSHYETGDFIRVSPEKDYGKLHHDMVHHIVQTQFTPGEKEGQQPSEVKPDTKQVNISFEEGKGVTVTETQSGDKEASFTKPDLPSAQYSQTSIDSHGVAVKTEVLADDLTKTLETLETTKTQASMSQLVFESLTQTESNVHEKESSFKEISPEKKQATADLLLGESITVETVTSGEKETTFDSPDKPDLRNAQPQISANITAQKTEVYADDTFKNIEAPSPDSANATSAHIELQSIIQCQTTPAEAESSLAADTKLEAKNAYITLEGVFVPEVEEIIPQDKEKGLEQPEKPTEKKAEQLLDVQPVAQTTITTAESTTGDVITQKPTEFTANVEQTVMESITQTHSIATESEGTLGKFDTDSKLANVEFEEGKSINVTEVTSADREYEYTPEEKAKEQTVTTQIDSYSVGQKEEVTANDFIDELSVKKPQVASAEPNILPFNTTLTSEIVLPESETPFSEIKQTTQQTASINVNEEQSIIIQTTLSVDKESYLPNFELPDSKFGATELTDMNSVATKTEVILDASFSSLEAAHQETQTANKETIPHESISQIDLVIGESESVFDGYPQVDTHMASADIQPCTGIIVSEITLADTDEAFIPATQPKEKYAEIDADITHKLIEQSVTIVSENVAALDIDTPELNSASKAADTLTSLIVSESDILEKEMQFIDQYKPNLSNVTIDLEEGKVAHNITEIYIQDKEEHLERIVIGEGKTATPAVSTHEVANKLEIVSAIDVDNFEQQTHNTATANVTQMPFESVISEKADIRESESQLEIVSKTVPKTADYKLEETSSVNVAEVTPAEKADELELHITPELVLAQKDITETKAAQTTEILTTICLGEISKKMPNEATAELSQDYLQGLIQTQNIPGDAEQPLKIKDFPENKQAEISLQLVPSVVVAETYSETREENYVAPKNTYEQATGIVDSMKALEQSQIMLHDTVRDILPEKLLTSHGNIEHTVLDSISSLENIVHEKEATLDLPTLPKNITADKNVIEQQCVNITEVVGEEKEIVFDKPETREHFASPNILEQQPIQQIEVQPQNTVAPISSEHPYSESAKSIQDKYESLLITENYPQEQETHFAPTITEKKHADVELLPEKHIYIEETLTKDKEGTFGEQIFQLNTAEKSVFPQQAMEVTQIVANQGVTDLIVTKTEPLNTQSQQIPFENITVTEYTPSDKEATFEKQKQHFETASPQIDVTGKTAVTHEINAQGKESLLPEQQLRTDKASFTLLEDKPLEQYDTNILDSVDLIPKCETPLRKAVTKQSTLESLIETTISATEQENYIEIEHKDGEIAQLVVTTQESISVIEINPQEQESDKVITGTAKEETAEEEIRQQHVALNEETISLNATDILKPNSFKTSTAKQIQPSQQHGIIVSEQKSTGELQSVPCIVIPNSKTGRVAFEDTTSSLLVSEIQLHDKEGK